MEKHQNYKFCFNVESDEQSLALQLAAFNAGYKWCSGAKDIFLDNVLPYFLIFDRQTNSFECSYHPGKVEKINSLSECMMQLQNFNFPNSQPTYKLWCAVIGNDLDFETIQRIAFGFGYTWKIGGGQNIVHGSAAHVLFNPSTKKIDWSLSNEYISMTCASSVASMVRYLKDPPTEELFEGKSVFFLGNGAVQIGAMTFSKEDLDKVVSARDERLGVQISLSHIRFEYRGAKDKHSKIRDIVVFKEENGSIEGMDLDDSLKFKKFLTERITKGTIIWCGFKKVPSKFLPKK